MGFEVVVRPAVFPNIRPAPAQSLPPLDDPDKGFAVIRGNGAKQIDLSSSWSSSTSMNQRQETKRRFDEVRVYQQDDDGTINKDNFVDTEVINKLWMKDDSAPAADNSGPFILPEGKGFFTPRKGEAIEIFTPPKEKDNIEITKRNVIRRADDA